MQRRTMLIGLALLPATPTQANTSWMLVTEDEYRRSHAAGPLSMPRAMPSPDGPAILVQAPADPTQPLKPPILFRVAFQPPQGAKIDVKSFQALYGTFNIDITSRLLEHCSISPNGFEAKDMAIPAGEHRVTLIIADNQGHQSTRTFRFVVAQGG
jgi:hypothetical protein